MSSANLACHVEGKMIAAYEGVARWHSGCERVEGASPRFTERWGFERKHDGDHHPCHESIFGLHEEVRRVFLVYINAVIGRGGLVSLNNRYEARCMRAGLWTSGVGA